MFRVTENSAPRDKSIDIMGLYDLIDEYGSNSLGESWSFYPETDIYSKPEVVSPTAISFKVNNRRHFEQSHKKPAYKSRSRGEDKEDDYTEFGEMFQTIIDFAFWGKEYRKANNEREWFEKFIHKRKSDLKQAGVLRFLFEGQQEDQVIEINNNYYIKLTVMYKVIHPRIVRVPYDRISDIQSRLKGCVDSQGITNRKFGGGRLNNSALNGSFD